MKTRNFLKTSVFSFLLLLALISCKPFTGSIMVVDEESNSDYVTFTGILENYKEVIRTQANVSSSQNKARTINPEVSVNDYDFYLFGQADYGNTENVIGPYPITMITATANNTSDGVFKCTLPKGLWYLTLTAFKSESNGGTKPVKGDLKYFYTNDETKNRPLLTGMAVCDVSKANTSNPKFLLSPEGLTTKGNVSLQIELEGWNILKADGTPKDDLENIGVKCGINNLNPYAANPVIVSETDITMTQTSGTDSGTFNASDITPGNYEFNFIFYNKTKTQTRWVWSDTITIYPGRDTNTTVYIPEIKLKMTASGDAIIPEAPSNFIVSHYKTNSDNFISTDGLFYTTVFEWTDNSYNENGFEIQLTDIDDISNSITFDKNIEFYKNNYVSGSLFTNKNKLEVRIPFGHRYKAQICALNDTGRSAWCDAKLKTTDLDTNQAAFKQLGADSSADEWNALNMYKVSYFLNGGKLNEAVKLNGEDLVKNTTDFVQYGPVSGDFAILDKGKIIKRLDAPDHWSSTNSDKAPAETTTEYNGYKNLDLWAIYPAYMLDEPPAPPSNLRFTTYGISDTGFLSSDSSAYGVIFEWDCEDNDADFEIRLKDINTNETILMDKYIYLNTDSYISVSAPDQSSLEKGSKKLHAYVPFGNVYSVEIRSTKGSFKSHNDNENWIQATNNINMFKIQYNLSGGNTEISGTPVANPVVYGSFGTNISILEKSSISRNGINPDKFYTDSLFTTEYTENSYTGYQNLELWVTYPNLKSPSNFRISHYKTDDANFLSAKKTSYAVIFEWDYPDSDTVSDFEIRLQDADNPTSYIVMNKITAETYKVTGSTGSLTAGSRRFEGYVPFGKRYLAEIYAVNSGIYSDPESDSNAGKGNLIDTGDTAFVRQTADTTSILYNALNLFTISYEFNGGYNYKKVTLRNELEIQASTDTVNNLEQPFIFSCDKNTYNSFVWFSISDTDKKYIITLDNNPCYFNYWALEPSSSTEFSSTSYTHNGYSNIKLWAQYAAPTADTQNRKINYQRIKYSTGSTNNAQTDTNWFDESKSTLQLAKGQTISFTLTPSSTYSAGLFKNIDAYVYKNVSVKILDRKDKVILDTEPQYAHTHLSRDGIFATYHGETTSWTWSFTVPDDWKSGETYTILITGTSYDYKDYDTALSNSVEHIATIFFTVN